MKVENRKARFDYEVIEAMEAGIILSGAEVKSVKAGQVNLTGSRIITRDGRMFVVGMNIPQYQFSSDKEYDPGRIREILMHKKEMTQIEAKRASAGLTLIPLSVYNKGSLIKLLVGLVRGKKKYEKRALVAKRTEEKALARRFKK